MKQLLVDLPEALATEVEAVVKAGWFGSESQLVRAALAEFVRQRRFELLEQFQQEDIAWAIAQKGLTDRERSLPTPAP